MMRNIFDCYMSLILHMTHILWIIYIDLILTASVPHGFKTFCLIVLQGQCGQKLYQKLDQKLTKNLTENFSYVENIPNCRVQSADMVIFHLKVAISCTHLPLSISCSWPLIKIVRSLPKNVLENSHMTWTNSSKLKLTLV